MDLIPITKVKPNFTKWINEKVKYEDNLYSSDILDEMFNQLVDWLESKDDIEILSDKDALKNNFIKLIYNKYSF